MKSSVEVAPVGPAVCSHRRSSLSMYTVFAPAMLDEPFS
jgi:hypothetical protein